MFGAIKHRAILRVAGVQTRQIAAPNAPRAQPGSGLKPLLPASRVCSSRGDFALATLHKLVTCDASARCASIGSKAKT